jgi:predicted nucleic acid-binding Zn ribbon protein
MSYKPPSRKSRLTKSDAVLQALFQNGKSPLSGPFLRWKLWKKWPEFVGPTMAAVSEPVALRNGVLSVWVKNAAWMQQMVFLKQQMRKTLNQKLGEDLIHEIHLTMDRKAVPQDPEEKRWLEATVKNLMKDAGDE